MAKKAVSLTLDEGNLLWLKGRARVASGGNVSEAVNQLVSEARAGRLGASATPRSVVGTVDISIADPRLGRADAALKDLFTASLGRPMMVREEGPGFEPARGKRRG